MTTVSAPPAIPKAPEEAPLETARELLTRREDPRSRLIRLATLLAAAVLLIVGWRVVGIDLPKLFLGLPAAQHILVGLVTPDLIRREVTTTELSAPFRVGEGPQDTVVVTAGSQTLTITPRSVRGGQTVTFAGDNFAPSSTGTLSLEFSAARGRKISDVETDANGRFELSFAWPSNIEEGDYQVRLIMNAPTGRMVPSEVLGLALSKMAETILLALMGTVFGVLISVPLSFFGARNLMEGSPLGMAAYFTVRTIFNLGRSIEVLILAVIMAVVVGIGPFAGMMAIVLHSIGAMGKLYSESIESIDPGPIEAVTATGANRFQTVIFAVVPQVIPQFLSFTMYRWDINVRMSTVVGLVGGGGIGFLLIQYINLLQWSQAATALWLIAIVVMAMDYASAAFRARLV
jgi:phosphonate transport system permease protein